MKKAAWLLAFLCVFALTYGFVDEALRLKSTDGIQTMEHYYELPGDTVDVLMAGSSHVGMNIPPAMLWDEYGIASYNLWGGMQPIWNSYYYVKEGLKSQKPKLVVVEAFLCGVEAEYSDSVAALKSTQAMHLSVDKISAALASFSTWQSAAEALWGMPTYHSRYDELTRDDFASGSWSEDTSIQEINHNVGNVTPLTLLDYSAITDELPLSEKSETYLRRTIQLCKGANVELLLLISPYQANEAECMRLNTVERIAREEGVACLNYLKRYKQAGIDPQTDFYDIGHLNTAGIPKLTRDFGRYLKAHYELPDRRGDEKHIWNTGKTTASDRLPAYQLAQSFAGDGQTRCVDTGVKLYENRYGTWTLLARVDTRTADDSQVFFSCFSEVAEKGNYGLLVKKQQEGRLTVKLGSNSDVDVAYTGDTLDLAIVKQSEAYTLYANGEAVITDYELSCPAYEGSLLIGCQELSPGGEKYRFSRTNTLNMEIYDYALSSGDIAAWSPEELPPMPLPLGVDVDEPEEVYTLAERFMGGDERYRQSESEDTGVALFEEASTRFTLLARVTPQTLGADNVFFACFAEEADHYRGLLVRQTQEGVLDVIVGNNLNIPVPCQTGRNVDLAVVKDGETYTVYADGVRLADQVSAPCEAYGGSLLIGCQVTAEGERFRYSHTLVNSLTVMSGVMSEQSILRWDYADAPLPPERVATSAAYTLPAAFLGDGKARFLDTGVMLYDAAKDWTLGVTLTPAANGQSDVILSCFSEEPGRYRGLMIRKDTDGELTVWVGNNVTYKMQLAEPTARTRVVVVKHGDEYAIYRDGALETSVTSACPAYEGRLLLGCQETVEGERFRFSPVRIEALTVSDGAMDADEALRFSVPDKTNSRF